MHTCIRARRATNSYSYRVIITVQPRISDRASTSSAFYPANCYMQPNNDGAEGGYYDQIYITLILTTYPI